MVLKRHFTLLESLLVILVMALLAGVVIFNVNKAVHEQHFRAEVGVVLDKLRLAQNLMLVLNQDVHLKMAVDPENGGNKVWLETDCPLSPGWEREIMHMRHNLKTVRIIEFDDKLNLHKRSGEVDIRFLSGGMVMSKGILRLATGESSGERGALERFICLKGYPHPFRSVVQKPDEDRCLAGEDADFNEKMTQYTVQEIAAKRLQNESPKKEDAQINR